ncbi:MerR family transcriptional regulator [Nonomuraea thailandensis]|uniref:MerR family transcriptional regulator n=1 Tax=Nonomuraea thailandensis TaxID=1188745 RepID=UPI0027E3B28D|nr:MerR family transcriptional regulator [Nonomuraea thailandensis]
MSDRQSADALHTIGELARRTGLPARTIRFWSDSGVLPPRRPFGGRLPPPRRLRPDPARPDRHVCGGQIQCPPAASLTLVPLVGNSDCIGKHSAFRQLCSTGTVRKNGSGP